MFNNVFESMMTITNATVGMQHEMFKKWLTLWPGNKPTPITPLGVEQLKQFQQRWTETIDELLQRQRKTIDAQFKVGQENIAQAFRIGEIKNIEELRAKTLELWQKCFESVVQLSETQVRDFQVAMQKWFELVTPPVPPA